MQIKYPLALIFSFILFGCATTDPAPLIDDNSPTRETAVVKTKYNISGRYVPSYSGTQLVLTRPDHRSIRSNAKFKNFLMRWANSDMQYLTPISSPNAYGIRHHDKSYYVCVKNSETCKLSILEEILLRFSGKLEDDKQEEHVSYGDLECPVNIVKNDLSTEKTGLTKTLNGFNAEEYLVTWALDFQDNQGRVDNNIVTFQFWTTPRTTEISRVQRIHSDFFAGFDQDPNNRKITDRVGYDSLIALDAFFGDLDNREYQLKGELGRELQKVQGYPVSITTRWVRNATSCVEERAQKEKGLDLTKNPKDIGKQLLGNILDKTKQKAADAWMKKPLINYVYETTYSKVDFVRDSQFEVPKQYKVDNR